MFVEKFLLLIEEKLVIVHVQMINSLIFVSYEKIFFTKESFNGQSLDYLK